MSERNPYATPTVRVMDVSGVGSEVDESLPFFAVSLAKLSVMSVCTFGCYEIYWFYKHWDILRSRERLDIWPFSRAFFAPLFCYQCFSRVRQFQHPGLGASRLQAGALATGWIVLSLLWRLPDPYWLVSMCAFVFLLPVQRRANAINAAIRPGHDPNGRYTALNWVAIVVGSILWSLGIVGMFLPPE